jgi:hypothetical protein
MIKEDIDYVIDAQLQNIKAGSRIGMDASTNSDRYGSEKVRELVLSIER